MPDKTLAELIGKEMSLDAGSMNYLFIHWFVAVRRAATICAATGPLRLIGAVLSDRYSAHQSSLAQCTRFVPLPGR